MFHHIDQSILEQMQRLEAEDARERADGVPRSRRLRQIPPETGRFLAILVASAPDGDIVEIGTSGGYSTLWLTVGCAESGRRVTTFEIDPAKIQRASETFRSAGVEDMIDLRQGDARQLLTEHDRIAFCFLDAEKEDYFEMYELIVARHVPGGLLVADNVISHAETLGAVVIHAEADHRVDAVVVPIGKGELLCRRVM